MKNRDLMGNPLRDLLILAALFVALLLAGCAPAVIGEPVRDGEQVTIGVSATVPFFDVTLTVLRATTDDERCLAIGGDLSCSLGDLAVNEQTSVVVVGVPGEVGCTLAGFRDQALSIGSYRTFACR